MKEHPMSLKLAKPALDVGFVTTAAEPMLDFYESVLGAERLPPLEIPNIGTIHKLACGESILRVMVPAQAPAPRPEADDPKSFSAVVGIRYLTLEVRNIEAVVEAVRSNGGRVDLEPFELRPGRRVAQVADPDGNMIEIGEDA
jgi:catechol 2,3-dioxygenase-like lactoylglutathione lyase family enzyme